MNELELYYSNLFGGRNCVDRKIIFSFINDLTDVPYLAKEKRNVCESILGYIYMMNATMYCRPSKKNKSPGNNGLTVEFYLAFWPMFGKLVVDSLSHAFEYGGLSNSQKKAVITIIERKRKDKLWCRIGVQYLL